MPVERLLLLDRNRKPTQPIIEKIGLFSRADLPLWQWLDAATNRPERHDDCVSEREMMLR